MPDSRRKEAHPSWWTCQDLAYRRRSRTSSNPLHFARPSKKQLAVAALIVAAVAVAVVLMRYVSTQKNYDASFLVANDTIRVGIRVGVPGFGEMDENGEIVGFDRDYIDLVLDRLIGSDPKIFEYVPLTSQDAGAAIKYGVADICLGQLSSGLLQTNGFTLTQPYFTDRVVAVVPETSQIASIRELADGVGYLQTAIAASTAREQLEEIGMPTELISYADYESALSDLDHSRIGAVLMPYETARQFTRQGYRILTEELFTLGYGILLPSGQAAVAAEMSAAIAALSENGTTGVLRTKWDV